MDSLETMKLTVQSSDFEIEQAIANDIGMMIEEYQIIRKIGDLNPGSLKEAREIAIAISYENARNNTGKDIQYQ